MNVPQPLCPEGYGPDVPHRSRPHRSPVTWLVKPVLRTALDRWRVGRLTAYLPDRTIVHAGRDDAEPHATVWVHRNRMLCQFLLRGDIGVGESYMSGDWQADDLPAFLELALLNTAAVGRDTWLTRILNAPADVAHALRRNTRRGSRRNIGRHYDLGNDLFALFLDPSMTYSSALFEGDDTLLAAQERKFARLASRATRIARVSIGSKWSPRPQPWNVYRCCDSCSTSTPGIRSVTESP